ncbi:MAG TPA: 50S ribosomal protein L4 [Dissulfurispiraceae bacterium]|nr:50S ribosomal protein L4 [Dissulfurispiraceae bacterium]
MIDIEIRDINNNTKGKLSLAGTIFGSESSAAIVHSAVVSHLANQRQGTHATKTRGLVSGGGKKPYKQKGTGRARAGSSRSPLFRGGGTIFGPHPRDYEIRMPKSARKAALSKALTMKLADSEIVVIDDIKMDKPRTKDMLKILDKLGLGGQSVLLVLAEGNDNVYLSTRNIPAADVTRVSDLNAYQVASYSKLVFTEAAIKKLAAEEVSA